MTLSVFTAGTLTQVNTSATVSITAPYGGSTTAQSYLQDSLPVIVGPVNPGTRGIYITPSSAAPPLSWQLQRHSTMYDSWQIVRQGDGNTLAAIDQVPLAILTATDMVTLTITQYNGGSLTLNSVQ